MTINSVIKPRADVGLLILRLGAGVSLLLLFGWPKLKDANQYLHTGEWMFVEFNRKVGLPAPVLIASIQSLNESLGALLVACGLFARFAALCLTIGFAAATYYSLRMNEDAWLIAMLYAVMFCALLFAGPGKYSIDFLRSHRRSHLKKV